MSMKSAVNKSFIRQVAHVDQPHLEDDSTIVLSYAGIGPDLIDSRKLGTKRRLDLVETVFLDHNKISNVANFQGMGDLPRLNDLYLDWNALSHVDGRNPLFQNLLTLSLTSNRVQSIDSAFAFSRLRVLRLSNNKLKSLNDVFAGVICASLQTLIVAYNEIANVADMVDIVRLTGLEVFDFRHNPVGSSQEVTNFVLLSRPTLRNMNGQKILPDWKLQAQQWTATKRGDVVGVLLKAAHEMTEFTLQAEQQVSKVANRSSVLAQAFSAIRQEDTPFVVPPERVQPVIKAEQRAEAYEIGIVEPKRTRSPTKARPASTPSTTSSTATSAAPFSNAPTPTYVAPYTQPTVASSRSARVAADTSRTPRPVSARRPQPTPSSSSTTTPASKPSLTRPRSPMLATRQRAERSAVLAAGGSPFAPHTPAPPPPPPQPLQPSSQSRPTSRTRALSQPRNPVTRPASATPYLQARDALRRPSSPPVNSAREPSTTRRSTSASRLSQRPVSASRLRPSAASTPVIRAPSPTPLELPKPRSPSPLRASKYADIFPTLSMSDGRTETIMPPVPPAREVAAVLASMAERADRIRKLREGTNTGRPRSPSPTREATLYTPTPPSHPPPPPLSSNKSKRRTETHSPKSVAHTMSLSTSSGLSAQPAYFDMKRPISPISAAVMAIAGPDVRHEVYAALAVSAQALGPPPRPARDAHSNGSTTAAADSSPPKRERQVVPPLRLPGSDSRDTDRKSNGFLSSSAQPARAELREQSSPSPSKQRLSSAIAPSGLSEKGESQKQMLKSFLQRNSSPGRSGSPLLRTAPVEPAQAQPLPAQKSTERAARRTGNVGPSASTPLQSSSSRSSLNDTSADSSQGKPASPSGDSLLTDPAAWMLAKLKMGV